MYTPLGVIRHMSVYKLQQFCHCVTSVHVIIALHAQAMINQPQVVVHALHTPLFQLVVTRFRIDVDRLQQLFQVQ